VVAGETKTTTDHETIRKWVEQRGGRPATVASTRGDNDPGLLRVNFPGYRGEGSLEPISWDDFFRKFDEKHLVFLFQDQTRSGGESRFFKFLRSEGGQPGGGDGRRSTSRSGGSQSGTSRRTAGRKRPAA
jgi:hypothetical protein